jgi:carbon monoxide dehydrogenase subunit G
MAVNIRVDYDKPFQSARDAATTFEYLSDLKTAVPKHFRGVQTFEEKTPSVFHWIFEKIAHSGREIQIRFATQKSTVENKQILLTSVGEPGFDKITASWDVHPAGPGSEVRFKATLEVELPIPGFLKAVIAPMAQRELAKFFDRYIENVEKTLAA